MAIRVIKFLKYYSIEHLWTKDTYIDLWSFAQVCFTNGLRTKPTITKPLISLLFRIIVGVVVAGIWIAEVLHQLMSRQLGENSLPTNIGSNHASLLLKPAIN